MSTNASSLSPASLQSAVIDWLRMPLAVAVVFIHCFGSGDIDLAALHEEPLMMAAYIVRPLLTVALCIALYWLLERCVPRLLAVLTGGRVTPSR